ncbi:MAG: hypothetical protein LLG37_00550 [Spirochaetia bacterium]|nr:hypothetical protein [Spirochaetia bacterium]
MYNVFFVSKSEFIYMEDGTMIDAAIVERGEFRTDTERRPAHFSSATVKKIKNISKKYPQQKSADIIVAEDIKRGSQFKPVPADDELKIAGYEAYMAIMSMQAEMEAMCAERQQMKVPAGMAAGAVPVGVIAVFIAG